MTLKSLKYWLLAGLLVPAFFLTINFMLDRTSLAIEWHYILLTLWPTSFLLMALHGNELSASAILIYVISFGTNVIVYSIIGATLLALRNSWRNDSDLTAAKNTIKTIAVLYVAYAFVGLFGGIPLLLTVTYGSRFLDWIDAAYNVNLEPVVGIMNASVSCLIAYSFWHLYRWGRYVAISYNATWLVAFLLGFILSRQMGSAPVDPIVLAFLLSLVFLVFPAIVLVFSFRQDAKIVMAN